MRDPGTHPGRNCANVEDPNLFFPPASDIRGCREATKMCEGCPVVEECLRWAIDREWGHAKAGRTGIYGQTTPPQRFAIEQRWRSERQAAA